MASARQRGKTFTGYWRKADGKQGSKGGFPTETEALAHAIGEERAASKPELLHRVEIGGRTTVAGYAPGWLKSQSLEPNTRAAYANSVGHIVSRMGSKAVADVGEEDIRKLVQSLEKLGRKDSTISHTLTVAGLLFESAVRAKLIEANPCEGVKHRIKDRREMQIATQEQARQIQEVISPQFRLLVKFLFASGCRWSEAIAIRGTDVERRGSGYVVRIRKTINETWSKGKTEIYAKDYGKSESAKRDITIPPDLAKELMAFGDRLCFSNSKGGWLRRADFRRRHWKPAVKAVGLPGLRVHDTRHSAVSWWANTPGIPLAAVRDRAGHSNISVTSGYIHTIGDDPFAAVFGQAA